MDVRKNLVELLHIAHKKVADLALEHDEKTYSDAVGMEAAELIANGVTVQEWIPVDERLPENFISVLGYMTDAGEFPPVRECYTVGNVFFFPSLGDVHPVSHWCEMPQPPKGE